MDAMMASSSSRTYVRSRMRSALRKSTPVLRNSAKNGRHCNLRPRVNIHHKNQHQRNLRTDVNTRTQRGANFLNGKFTREVCHAVCGRLGQTSNIPGDSVQAVFNDMHLFPSKAQVSEMLQCARQVGRRNGTSSYLTIGELCLFAREMKNPKIRQKQNKSSDCKICEVFLGGSCNPTTWRIDTAIPELQKHGITYYNPQVSVWAPELVAQEHHAKQSASLLLFVVDSQTRSVSGMIEVAYLVAAGRCVVLVAYPYREGQSIMDEPITNSEYMDLVNAQTSLLALVKGQGLKVHGALSTALLTTANILRNTNLNNGMTAQEQVTYKLRKLREAFDSLDTTNSGEINLLDVLDAYYRLTNRTIETRSLCNYLSTNVKEANDLRITFEQFCALVAEFSDDGCEPLVSDGWMCHPLRRQCSTNNNVHYEEIRLKNMKTTQEYNKSYDVYLGGSCSDNSWRNEVIPILKKQGVTYFNPAVTDIKDNLCVNDHGVCESEVLRWRRAMDKSNVLLFYVTANSRSLTTMILAANYIGLNRKIVLCLQHLPADGLKIGEEELTKQAIKDYNRGRVYLQDLAKRKKIPVFESITEAVQAAIDKRNCS